MLNPERLFCFKVEIIMEEKIKDRFFKYVEVTDGCWLWQGATAKGYGRFSILGKSYYSHRVSYNMFIGELNPDLTLDHLCEVTNCVNPFHLEEVSLGENARRAVFNKYPRNPTHCKYGHLYTPETKGMSKNNTIFCRYCAVIGMFRSRYKKGTLHLDNPNYSVIYSFYGPITREEIERD